MPRKNTKKKARPWSPMPAVPVRVWPGGQSYEARVRQIKALLEHDQPFVLSRYLVSAILVPDRCSWFHEIILWQSREGDIEQQSLVVTPEIFRALVDEFGMTLVEKTDEGSIYECNGLMRGLSEEYRNEMARHRAAIDVARQTYLIKKEGCSRGWVMTLRRRLEAAEEAYARASRQFAADHGIYTYRFVSEPGAEPQETAPAAAEEP
jgi:hypothetical protein